MLNRRGVIAIEADTHGRTEPAGIMWAVSHYFMLEDLSGVILRRPSSCCSGD
jgi:hypothetical protein